jgi:hypothetical protein
LAERYGWINPALLAKRARSSPGAIAKLQADLHVPEIGEIRNSGMSIVRFALRFPYTFYGLAALIMFLGILAIVVMPVDIFPEINIPVVTVIWQYTGLSTPEMEQRVTTYSQYAISTSVNGIRNMEAQTLNGRRKAGG